MLPEGAVRVERLWKRFRADDGGHFARAELARIIGALRRDVESGWRWVLRDISFDVDPGETVGLVGVNGSGKTTLLMAIAGTMTPSAGHASTAGRVSALIDLSAGIHSELTGRENIRLYMRMIGLSRRETSARFDEIVAFAGLEDALDRQVKFYSSGMKVRLGFSILTHASPALLIVDEALAVGDAVFRQQCLQRMRTLVAEGATLLFVSHGLEAIQGLCTRSIWLADGSIRMDGPTGEVLTAYRQRIAQAIILEGSEVSVVDSRVIGRGGGAIVTGGDVMLTITLLARREIPQVVFSVGVSQGEGEPIFLQDEIVDLPEGTTTWEVEMSRLPLGGGVYRVWLGLNAVLEGPSVLSWRPLCRFIVDGPQLSQPQAGVARLAPVWVETVITRRPGLTEQRLGEPDVLQQPMT